MDTQNLKFDTMTASEAAELLRYHNRLYWELNEPEISDAEFDLIYEKLRELAPDHPALNEIHTPEVDSRGKVRHSSPMLSLDKAYSLSALLEWAGKYARSADEKILVEPKYDGISARFDGKVLVTRGDGEFGEDITDKLPLIELEAPGYVGELDRPARGELLIREDDFSTIYRNIRKKDGSFYRNSRNAVAGIVGLKDISSMLMQHAKITLADYSLYSYEVKFSELESRWEELKEQLAALPYPQDGIVLKFADEMFRKSLGNTAHHPRGEIAYKFTNIRKTTKLVGVEWSFGKNCLTPVALLEPVEISGTTIRRASLHNVQNILELGVMIGDEVVVERAGDVIPYISAVTPGSERKSPLINKCPSCGAELTQVGPELVCTGTDCPETSLQRLCAAVRNLGIERLGEPTLRRIMEKFGVRRLSQLFELKVKDILQLEGFAQKSASNLVGEISKARTVKDYQLLASLNIPHIGLNMARQLLRTLTIEQLRSMGEEELSLLDGVGPERARALVEQFSVQKEYLDELLAALTVTRGDETGAGASKSVCFTGKMPEKRSYYEHLASENGYTAVDSVTKELSLLVAADPSASGGKLDKARKFNVKIISLDEFLSTVSGNTLPDDNGSRDLFDFVSPEEPGKDEDPFANGELFSFDA